MKYSDNGLIIQTVPYLETDYIVSIFTQKHGVIKGICKYANTKKHQNSYQLGTYVELTWSARSENALGTITLEPITSYASLNYNNIFALTGIQAICGLSTLFFMQKEQNSILYDGLLTVMNNFRNNEIWLPLFIRWGVELLDNQGFPLDFTKCILTNTNKNLRFISPKTGRCICQEVATPWISRLLTLPYFLTDSIDKNSDIIKNTTIYQEIYHGLVLIEYFLTKILKTYGKYKLPPSIQRLKTLVSRKI